MSFEVPHKDDLATNSKLPGQLTENFKALEQEMSDRIAADNAEAGTRSGADSDLQRQIDSLNTRLTTAERNIIDLQTRTSSLEDQVKKLNEIIFGTQYINDTDDKELDDSMVDYPEDVEVNDTKVIEDDKAVIDTSDQGYVTAGEEVN